ncbi:MAG: hypothetical protein HC886_14040 [Leptolyngbyaceae cyanobacterium SM1_1_3]|nr:hypothetical protein [Leptolyngbyaceae cyanobacterium SM1_1_3]NJO10672.1 hypothetical protein [Leptolyngbyaceae cyanobacterium SL_1_1]
MRSLLAQLSLTGQQLLLVNFCHSTGVNLRSSQSNFNKLHKLLKDNLFSINGCDRRFER